MLRSALALTLAIALHGVAHAQATYQFTLQGEGTHLWNFYECQYAPDYQACAFGPGAYVTGLDWSGTVTITTSVDADGVFVPFGDPGLVSFELVSNLVFFGTDDLSGPLGLNYMAVTVKDHRVTEINGGGHHEIPYFDPYTSVFFHDLRASYSFGDCHHCGIYRATATLSPVATSVPEPTTWLMVLAGLAAIGTAAQRRPHAALLQPLRSSPRAAQRA